MAGLRQTHVASDTVCSCKHWLKADQRMSPSPLSTLPAHLPLWYVGTRWPDLSLRYVFIYLVWTDLTEWHLPPKKTGQGWSCLPALQTVAMGHSKYFASMQITKSQCLRAYVGSDWKAIFSLWGDPAGSRLGFPVTFLGSGTTIWSAPSPYTFTWPPPFAKFLPFSLVMGYY